MSPGDLRSEKSPVKTGMKNSRIIRQPICTTLLFWNNPIQRGYKKRMIEIWQECTSFQTTSQRLADQVGTMIKTGWFSDLEILEIHQKINNEPDSNAISDIPSINKQKQSNRDEPPTSENRNATQPNNTEQT